MGFLHKPTKVRLWLGDMESLHWRIARGMLVVSGFVLIGKLGGAVKEMAVAWRYGVSNVVDSYLFVFNLVQWPISIFAGVIGAVVVPLAVRLKHEAPDALPQFRAELLGSVLLFGISLGAGTWLLLPWLVRQPWIGLDAGQVSLAVEMALRLAWIVPTAILFWLFSAWTMAANRHLNTLLEGVPAVAILISVLTTKGPEALITGTVIGFAMQMVLILASLVYRGEVEVPTFRFNSPHWQAFIGALGLMLVAQALSSLVSITDQFFAAHLGTGALSKLGYANRILALILSLGATSIGRAALPVLANSHAQGHDGIGTVAKRWAAGLFAIGSLCAIFVVWLAPHIVRVIFERGHFTAVDAEHVTRLLRFGMVQVPFYFASMVLIYALLVLRKQREVVFIAGVQLVTKVGMGLLLVRSYGLDGLLLATATTFMASSIAAVLYLRGADASNCLVNK